MVTTDYTIAAKPDIIKNDEYIGDLADSTKGATYLAKGIGP